MYVIYSKSETDANDGKPMFWSNEDGWVDFYNATTFTAGETEGLSVLGDGEWITCRHARRLANIWEWNN